MAIWMEIGAVTFAGIAAIVSYFVRLKIEAEAVIEPPLFTEQALRQGHGRASGLHL